MSSTSHDGLASTAQAAAYLATTPQGLAMLRHKGQGPAWVRLGRRIAYRWQDLDAYVEQHRHDPQETPAP